jgi:hypothetical protein
VAVVVLASGTEVCQGILGASKLGLAAAGTTECWGSVGSPVRHGVRARQPNRSSTAKNKGEQCGQTSRDDAC